MQTLHGTVANLIRWTHVAGDARTSATITAKVVIFDLAGWLVALREHEPAIISDGDEVAVFGQIDKDGIFQAHAYRNLTRGIHGGTASAAPLPAAPPITAR